MAEMKNPYQKLAQIFGRRGGKVGGRSTSDKKKLAVRENGKKGGRPKRVKDDLNKGTED